MFHEFPRNKTQWLNYGKHFIPFNSTILGLSALSSLPFPCSNFTTLWNITTVLLGKSSINGPCLSMFIHFRVSKLFAYRKVPAAGTFISPYLFTCFPTARDSSLMLTLVHQRELPAASTANAASQCGDWWHFRTLSAIMIFKPTIVVISRGRYKYVGQSSMEQRY